MNVLHISDKFFIVSYSEYTFINMSWCLYQIHQILNFVISEFDFLLRIFHVTNFRHVRIIVENMLLTKGDDLLDIILSSCGPKVDPLIIDGWEAHTYYKTSTSFFEWSLNEVCSVVIWDLSWLFDFEIKVLFDYIEL